MTSTSAPAGRASDASRSVTPDQSGVASPAPTDGSGVTLVRYGVAVALSAAVNVGLVVSLAELARPATPEDPHQPHGVAPSVVAPPPPPETISRDVTAPPTAAALPAAPPAPNLDLPAPTELTNGPALAWGDLDDVGLGDLDGFASLTAGAQTTAPAPPDEAPQLTVPPDLARFYPAEARRRKLQGRTILGLTIDPSGRVIGVDVLRSDPPGIFERAASKAARSFRFQPGRRAGRAILATTRLELKWQLPN